ncbi:four helix bundle protein [Aureibaculum sp. 2210JD6-5]|uniref:four helix bundle protein n=1 Tax=Aureibaculum sp. 2210JD6-5 TaxID=3103957 RepID=UPI002AAD8B75|nr:four helix bundle protein [Aureibaculum sp. 2210JD6-5]MDY7395689.1 four helix bundle protein [Aureibaculum sp. 2210JD6-5]
MAGINSFEELACWKEARKLRVFVSKTILPKFPNSEKFELVSQMRRSSRSVGNNISEGFGRFHFQENIQFCRIARGSLDETLDHGITALDESYITEEDLRELRKIHDKVLRILNGYIKYLKAQKNK